MKTLRPVLWSGSAGRYRHQVPEEGDHCLLRRPPREAQDRVGEGPGEIQVRRVQNHIVRNLELIFALLTFSIYWLVFPVPLRVLCKTL